VIARAIDDIVKKEKAIAYDATGVELGHHEEKCSFDAIIEKYNLTDQAALDLAKIVRVADTSKLEAVPEAAGLDAVMTEISMAAKNDYEAIEKASLVYNVL
jgi:hypothetical protein